MAEPNSPPEVPAVAVAVSIPAEPPPVTPLPLVLPVAAQESPNQSAEFSQRVTALEAGQAEILELLRNPPPSPNLTKVEKALEAVTLAKAETEVMRAETETAALAAVKAEAEEVIVTKPPPPMNLPPPVAPRSPLLLLLFGK